MYWLLNPSRFGLAHRLTLHYKIQQAFIIYIL